MIKLLSERAYISCGYNLSYGLQREHLPPAAVLYCEHRDQRETCSPWNSASTVHTYHPGISWLLFIALQCRIYWRCCGCFGLAGIHDIQVIICLVLSGGTGLSGLAGEGVDWGADVRIPRRSRWGVLAGGGGVSSWENMGSSLKRMGATQLGEYGVLVREDEGYSVGRIWRSR